MGSCQSWFNIDLHCLHVKPGLTRIRVRRSSSRAYPGRDRYREGASRIGRVSARTSRRNGRDRALRIGRRAPSRPGEDVSPARDPRRSRRRPLGMLFREKTYAQDAIRAVSGRTLRQAGVGRGRVGQVGEAPPAQHEAPPVGRGGAFRSAGGVLPGGLTRPMSSRDRQRPCAFVAGFDGKPRSKPSKSMARPPRRSSADTLCLVNETSSSERVEGARDE